MLLPDQPGASCQPAHAPGKYQHSSQGWMASKIRSGAQLGSVAAMLGGRRVPVGGELPPCHCGGGAPKILQENAAGSVKAAGN